MSAFALDAALAAACDPPGAFAGLASRLCGWPAAAWVQQWGGEVDRTLGLPAGTAGETGWKSSVARPVVLASIAAARREPLKGTLTGGRWDVVVADEAHRLRSPRTASGRVARA